MHLVGDVICKPDLPAEVAGGSVGIQRERRLSLSLSAGGHGVPPRKTWSVPGPKLRAGHPEALAGQKARVWLGGRGAGEGRSRIGRIRGLSFGHLGRTIRQLWQVQ